MCVRTYLIQHAVFPGCMLLCVHKRPSKSSWKTCVMQNRCVDYRIAHTKINLQFHFRYTFWSILLFFVSDFCCRHHTAMCWEHSAVGVWREDHGLSLLALSFSFRLVQVFFCPSFFTLHSILCCIVRQTRKHELLLLSTNPEYSFHFFVFKFLVGGCCGIRTCKLVTPVSS